MFTRVDSNVRPPGQLECRGVMWTTMDDSVVISIRMLRWASMVTITLVTSTASAVTRTA